MWALLLIVLLVSALFTAVVVAQARGAVQVDPAVGIAQRAEMQLTLCNRDVDRVDLNPRHAELELERLLRDQGARSADVRIDRRDCPSRPR
ncbi:MAG: hypothetical protein M3N68_05770 [Actinomycetota bacterium]|nr:hypothetical protein [Actinomycetota bacterium]